MTAELNPWRSMKNQANNIQILEDWTNKSSN